MPDQAPSSAATSSAANALRERANALQRFHTSDPDNPALIADLADALLQLGEWARARELLEHQLRLQAQEPLARYRLAVALQGLGEAEAALGMLNALIEEGFDSMPVRLQLARLLAGARDWARLWAMLQPLQVAQLPAQHREELALLQLRALHYTGDLAQGLSLGQAWLAQGWMPGPGVCAALSTVALDLGDLAAVQAWLQRAGAEACHNNAELQTVQAYAQLADGQADAALEGFLNSSQREPNQGRAHLGAGLALATQGRLDAAIAALREAVRCMPGHLGSRHAMAWMYLVQSKIDEAAQVFEEAYAQDRNFGDSHGGLALIAALRGQRDVATTWLRSARRLDPRSMNAAMAMSILELGGDLSDRAVQEQGLKHLQRLLAEQPHWLQAMTKLARQPQAGRLIN